VIEAIKDNRWVRRGATIIEGGAALMSSKIVPPPVPEVDDREMVAPEYDLERAFRQLVAEWRSAVAHLSSTTRRVQHPAYQRIIALGPKVVPLLLRELKDGPDHWFAALRALTGIDPVPPADRGKMAAMTEAWIHWGEERDILRRP
jgi:hypothetical protein